MKFGIIGFGRIGKLVREVLLEKEVNKTDICIVDPNLEDEIYTKPQLVGDRSERTTERIYRQIGELPLGSVDTAICFTDPDVGYKITKAFLKSGIDTVVGTTKFYLQRGGALNKTMLKELENTAKEKNCRVMYASNFSLGMNVYWKIVRQMAEMLSKINYDPAVSEEHHNLKKDVAGTAKDIGKILLDVYPNKDTLNFNDFERKREDNEITVSVTRAGHIPGTHTTIFDSEVDTLELVHRVRDPKIFAKGAVDSAHWLKEQPPGLYNITDRLK